MREYAAIADRVARETTGPVLDWGCGLGQVTHLLRERAVDVTAFEWSPDADGDYEFVPLERYPEIEIYRSSDPVKLPFPDDSFECVLSCGVLEHVQHPDASLNEIHRVLHPNGRLLVYKLPNRFSYLEAIAHRIGIYYHGALANDRVYTRESAIALLSRHAFHVDAFRWINLLPLTMTHPAAQSLSGPLWVTNRALGRVPGLRQLATNFELDATAQ